MKFSVRLIVDGLTIQYDNATKNTFYEVILPKMFDCNDCRFEGFSNSMPLSLKLPEHVVKELKKENA